MPEKLTDIGSERAVLASLCQYGASAHVAVCDVLDEESFANSNNKIIYRCINHVLQNDQAPDIASIISAAEQLDLLESVNTKQELKYISSLYWISRNATNPNTGCTDFDDGTITRNSTFGV